MMDYLLKKGIKDICNNSAHCVQPYHTEAEIIREQIAEKIWTTSDASKKLLYMEINKRFYHGFTLADSLIFPAGQANSILETIADTEEKEQLKYEFAYLRGEFGQAKESYKPLSYGGKMDICAMNLTAVTAIENGDFESFTQVYKSFYKIGQKYQDNKIFKMILGILSYSYSSAMGIAVREIDTTKLSLLPWSTRKAIYLFNSYYYFYNKNYERVIGSLETVLSYQLNAADYTPRDIYIHLQCGLAYYLLNDNSKAEYHVNAALDLALPDGFILPFANFVLGYGMLLEQLIRHRDSVLYEKIMNLNKQIRKNWMSVCNLFVGKCYNTPLTQKEMQIAWFAKVGYANKEIAEKTGCSISSVRKKLEIVYEKLMIHGRKELEGYII